MAIITFPENRFDIKIKRGATYRIPATWKDSAGAVIPLAGLSAWLHIRHAQDSPNILFTLSTANGRILLANTAPNLTLYLSDEETASITTWRRGVQDFLIQFGNGDRRRPWKGEVFVDPEVTRGV